MEGNGDADQCSAPLHAPHQPPLPHNPSTCPPPRSQIIGVEPTGANAMAQSLARGERVALSRVDAFADGVAVKQVRTSCSRPRQAKVVCQSLAEGGGDAHLNPRRKMAHSWRLRGLRVRAGAVWSACVLGCCSGWVAKVKHLPLHKPLACSPTPPPPPSALPTSQVGMETFRVCRELVDGIVLVDNSAISAAIKVRGWKGGPGPPQAPTLHQQRSIYYSVAWEAWPRRIAS